MANVYIASTLSNWRRVRAIRDSLAARGVSVTYDWTKHNDGNPFVADDQVELKRSIAEAEAGGVLAADVLMVVMPGGLGTHFEFGMAFGLGKPIILLDDTAAISPTSGTSGSLASEATRGKPSFHFLGVLHKYTSEQQAIDAVVSIATGCAQRQHG